MDKMFEYFSFGFRISGINRFAEPREFATKVGFY